MAINLRQSSTSPNISDSNLVFAVTSNSSSADQFRFVCDINDDSGTLLQRVKQQPNPNDTGVFDLGMLISTYLGPTDPVWDIANVTANTSCSQDYQIRFGEEFSDSVTGFTTLYTGDDPDAAGNPNVSGSNYTTILNGVLNPQDQVNWNWNSGSKYEEESTDGLTTFNHQFGLTSFNTSSVRTGDYHTLSILNGNLAGITSSAVDSSLAQDIYAVVYRQYDATGSLLDTDILYNTTAGPRTTSSELWDDVYLDQDETTRLIHFPAGPQNIEDAGVPILADDTGYYTMTFYNQTAEPGVNYNGVWGEYRFEIDNRNCGYSGQRFAWKNEYGVWDYYNFSLAQSTTATIEREQYEQSFVDYSATNTVAYNNERRGNTQYQNRVTKNRTAETDYLTQVDADNLRELFYSTNVYAQQPDGAYFPVVLTDVTATEKTNPRSQKLFRYTVNYQYANTNTARL